MEMELLVAAIVTVAGDTLSSYDLGFHSYNILASLPKRTEMKFTTLRALWSPRPI